MIINNTIELETNDGINIYDLTPKIKEIVKNSSISNGSILIYTTHTTTAIQINEKEERLLQDFKYHFQKLAPENKRYLHDDIELRDCPPDERINAHSHLKAINLNSSETIPIINNNLSLGKWQSILFFELDGNRKRKIIVQLRGE